VDFKKEKVLLELVSIDKKACIQCDQAFPVALQCVDDANNPTVYIVTNLVGSGPDKQEQVAGSLHWHNDIEFELNLVPITRLYRHANAGSTQRVNWKDFSLYRDETPENRPFIDMHSLDPQVSSHLNSANEIE
jgi:hypothetical protein